MMISIGHDCDEGHDDDNVGDDGYDDDDDDVDEVGNHNIPERRSLPWSQVFFWTESIWSKTSGQIVNYLSRFSFYRVIFFTGFPP